METIQLLQKEIQMKKPNKCPCCGKIINNKKETIHGSYETGPYKYVCDKCWNNEYLFFPDKI